jgi:hypothetical protein
LRQDVAACFIGNPNVAKIGIVPAKPASFAAVWFGADFQAFRQADLDENVPAYCHDGKRGLSGIPVGRSGTQTDRGR